MNLLEKLIRMRAEGHSSKFLDSMIEKIEKSAAEEIRNKANITINNVSYGIDVAIENTRKLLNERK